MRKTILALIVATLFISGCADPSTTSSMSKTTTQNELIAKTDEEAASLGFPDMFISKKEETVNWSEAASAIVAGMDVEIYDTGVTLEVCGGVNCDM